MLGKDNYYDSTLEENKIVESEINFSKYNIATLSTLYDGGAATGSKRRIQALNKLGHNAYLCTPYSQASSCIPLYNTKRELIPSSQIWAHLNEKVHVPVQKIKTFSAREFFSLAIPLVDFRDMQRIFDTADIVHLHWIVGLFDYRHSEILMNKPVVWTLADMNAFTGGCHYSEGCEEYVNECKNCPLIGGKSSLAHETWQIKKEGYSKLKNLHIICPSKWLASCAAKSSLFRNIPIYYIPNALPIDEFIPTNKVIARLQLGLPLNKKLFIFGAEDLQNKRKGGDILSQALAILSNEKHKDFEILLLGHNDINLPYKTHKLGYITSSQQLALVYSAADAFLSSTLEDSGPLTVAESMLCGTPVVSFSVGHVVELIENKKVGYIAHTFTKEDFVNGIRVMLNLSSAESIRQSIDCRIMAKQFTNPRTSALRHTKLYQEIVHV